MHSRAFDGWGGAVGLLITVLSLARPAWGDSVSIWTASSGSFPDQVSPPWTLTDDATPENPTLGGGVLTLSTNVASERMFYGQTEPLIDTGSPFYIETRMRVASGFTTNASRAPAGIFITTAPGVGNALSFGLNDVFFNTSNLVKGPSFAIDTSQFHTYRVEFDGGSALRLFIDGQLRLTGSTFNDLSNGAQERLLWGDATILAGGVSEWQFVTHNALVVPLPAVAWMGLPLLALVAARAKRRRIA